MNRLLPCLVITLAASSALAGPPYATDDPEPTETGHYETYLFTGGTSAREGWDGAAGVDFNYGAATDLQLTAVLPFNWSRPDDGPSGSGVGNIELAAKYKFLHQQDVGVDVAFFPRVFLPAGSSSAGEEHASLLLPLWIGHEAGKWTTFGGGGCVINRGEQDARDFCTVGWALTRQITGRLQIGAEIYHEGADTKDGKAATGLGVGLTYDVDEHVHLMTSIGPGIQNAAETGRASWYASVLLSY